MNYKKIAKETIEKGSEYFRPMEDMLAWQISCGQEITDFECFIIEGKYVVVHKATGDCYYSEGLPEIIKF